MTARSVSNLAVVLSVGDTTYLDYGAILAKREGYGPQGNGGNGLLLHSALAGVRALSVREDRNVLCRLDMATFS